MGRGGQSKSTWPEEANRSPRAKIALHPAEIEPAAPVSRIISLNWHARSETEPDAALGAPREHGRARLRPALREGGPRRPACLRPCLRL